MEIAQDGVPVAPRMQIDAPLPPGARFFAARGALSGKITIGEDFELTDREIDEMVDPPL